MGQSHSFNLHSVLLYALLLCSALASPSFAARKNPDEQKVLLSNIKTLTLRSKSPTNARRVSPVDQLKCVGGTARGLYEVDTLRCKNAGSGYTDDDVQWTCTASLPEEFKLGSTEVMCEGFDGPNDEYVLKGSCGVEYRLMLTDIGEERYGKRGGWTGGWQDVWGSDGFAEHQRSKSGDLAAILFWIAFIGIAGWMLWAIFVRDRGDRGMGRGGNGWGGWGGGGGDGGPDDPPPPYTYRPPPAKSRASSSPSQRTSRPAQAQQQQWRPGFWTGALGGATAGYLAGNRRSGTQQQARDPSYWAGNGEGSSNLGRTRSGGGSCGSGGAGYGSARHESSGFGGTTRR